MKTKNITWKGLYYTSIEHCFISMEEKLIDIRSSIIGHLDNVIYKVEYSIRADKNWETIFFHINSEINNVSTKIQGQKTENGQWVINGDYREDLDLCTDIDISISPLTNSLPINRLHLKNGEETQINVLYIDVLKQQIIGVEQKYTRLTDTKYRYENIPNDFEAIIQVDHDGFVITYPTLFERTVIVEK